jgi:isoleucyl-tRNA synthetase
MDIAQKASSMVLALRRKEKIKVRQPLAKIMVPVLNEHFREQFEAVKNVILTEVNVKEVEFLNDASGIIRKKVKPNFKVLGPKHGKLMKEISQMLAGFTQNEIGELEKNGRFLLTVGEKQVILLAGDIEISTEDIPGWLVATEDNLTIALDIHMTPELRMEGIAREFINKIQNIRKENGFEVADRIRLKILRNSQLDEALTVHADYIRSQTLAGSLDLVQDMDRSQAKPVEIDAGVETWISVEKYIMPVNS